RGKSMQYELVFPDATRKVLLSVPHYDFHWQTLYALKSPLVVTAGSQLIVTAHFDNSTHNMHNPDASKSVRHGTATYDEMMIGFADYVIPRPLDRVIARVNPRIYDAYVGQYELAPGVVLSIVKDGQKLYAVSDGRRVELFPLSDTVFFSHNTESELTFVRNESGQVTGFFVTRNEKLVTVKKIK